MQPTKFGFGQPVRRKEDEACLRGNGRYVADVAPDGLCHAAVLRSPHAHARFQIKDVIAARGMPGVLLVLTADDIGELGSLPCTVSLPGQKITVPPYPILASGEALHVGDCLAFVVADTRSQAQDAVEAIAVEWEPLPCVVDARAALAAVAAKRLGRPVKWVAERTEHFLGDAHGRDNLTVAQLALDEKARFLALDVDTIANLGAYLSCYAPFIPYLGAGMLPGVYDIPACHIRVRAAYTNTSPVDAYRGAGRPEAAYVIERLVDAAARHLGIAPDMLRKRNFIRPRAMPYTTATGKRYDSGEFAAHMAEAQARADWNGFGKRVARSKKAGKLRGLGLATYIEACGGNGPENAKLRLDPDGGVTVLIGTQSTGQGHHTAYAQLVADHLDLAPERVRILQGDTDAVATGAGTGGSSSIPCGGASVAGAARKLATNLKALAADALEASPGDLEIVGGEVRIAGTDRAISFAEIAKLPGADPERLGAEDVFVPPQETFPNGTHLAEVEIDPETGAVEIVDYVVVDDFGMTLNPLLLAGQVHGGSVQGIGQALMEQRATIPDPAS